MKKIIYILLLLYFALCSCNQRDNYVLLRGVAQGGTYSIKFNTKGISKKPIEIDRAIDSILFDIDYTLSGYNDSSLLTKFNRGEKIKVHNYFRESYNLAYKYYKKTNGAVDCAMSPLYDAWGFGFKKENMPSKKKIDSLLNMYSMSFLKEKMPLLDSLVPNSLCLDKSKAAPCLNFNSIAQGYSCDKIAEYLHSLGVEDMLIEIGEIYCSGKNVEDKAWKIGIDMPIDGNNKAGEKIIKVISSDKKSCGIVTSGNYRKFYIKNGKKYSHTINPNTGYPVEHNLLSATILAPNSTDADAYATYCMVIGLDKAKTFVENTPDVEACLVYEEDNELKVWKSAGMTIIEMK